MLDEVRKMTDRLLAKLITDIHEYRLGTSKILMSFGFDPFPGSTAFIEQNNLDNPSQAKAAYNLGTLCIQLVDEHLSAYCRAITEPALPLVLWTNTRCILENASIGLWLLDKRISVHQRVIRYYEYRIRSLDERKKFADVSAYSGQINEAIARCHQLSKEAKIFSKLHDIPLSRMPSYTALVSTMLKQELLFRLCSSVIHANHWGLIVLGFPAVEIPMENYVEIIESSTSVGIDFGISSFINCFKQM
jgi:hypothetical protein